jgi:hypothetical protein
MNKIDLRAGRHFLPSIRVGDFLSGDRVGYNLGDAGTPAHLPARASLGVLTGTRIVFTACMEYTT